MTGRGKRGEGHLDGRSVDPAEDQARGGDDDLAGARRAPRRRVGGVVARRVPGLLGGRTAGPLVVLGPGAGDASAAASRRRGRSRPVRRGRGASSAGRVGRESRRGGDSGRWPDVETAASAGCGRRPRTRSASGRGSGSDGTGAGSGRGARARRASPRRGSDRERGRARPGVRASPRRAPPSRGRRSARRRRAPGSTTGASGPEASAAVGAPATARAVTAATRARPGGDGWIEEFRFEGGAMAPPVSAAGADSFSPLPKSSREQLTCARNPVREGDVHHLRRVRDCTPERTLASSLVPTRGSTRRDGPRPGGGADGPGGGRGTRPARHVGVRARPGRGGLRGRSSRCTRCSRGSRTAGRRGCSPRSTSPWWWTRSRSGCWPCSRAASTAGPSGCCRSSASP